jgi:quercetin dioxygenase-like cupin family protein
MWVFKSLKGALKRIDLLIPPLDVQSVDTAAGTESPHHRTESLDYVIMLNGEVTLELENGKKTVLKAGDVAIQQGT